MKNLGCFCYLVNHSGNNSIGNCIQSLRLLNTNYLQKFPTPVICFHETGLTNEMKQVLINHTQVPLTFVHIDFSTPSHITEINAGWRIGYMHMCQFFANRIFHQPILDDFEYYCRLDTDSYILSPVQSNIFEDAKRSDTYYGFINDSLRDDPPYVIGLWETAKKFIEAHPEIPIYSKLYTDIEERRLYYTNFEMCNISWFKQDTWQKFFEEVDKAGGIYKYRWGDHIIRYIGVRSFMSPEHIRRVTNVHYSHQGLVDNKP